MPFPIPQQDPPAGPAEVWQLDDRITRVERALAALRERERHHAATDDAPAELREAIRDFGAQLAELRALERAPAPR